MGETQNEKDKAAQANRKAVMVSAVICGALLWIIMSAVTGDKEAWDSMYYWSVGFPLLLLTAFIFGCICRDRPLAPGIWLGVGHGTGSFLSGLYYSSGFGLWPVSLGIIGLFSIALGVASLLGGMMARLWIKAER
jgi:hypothetical protein